MSKARAIADAFEADGDLKEAAGDNITPKIGGAFVGTNGSRNGTTGSEDIFRIHTRVVDAQTTIPADAVASILTQSTNDAISCCKATRLEP